MAYDKPKVTIDLEEYNNLIKEHADLRKQLADSDISMYKKAIYHALACGGRKELFLHNCERDGVRVIFQNTRMMSIDVEEWEGINVSKITQTKQL